MVLKLDLQHQRFEVQNEAPGCHEKYKHFSMYCVLQHVQRDFCFFQPTSVFRYKIFWSWKKCNIILCKLFKIRMICTHQANLKTALKLRDISINFSNNRPKCLHLLQQMCLMYPNYDSKQTEQFSYFLFFCTQSTYKYFGASQAKFLSAAGQFF